MSTNGFNTNDSEMTECDGDKVVTMVDVLEEQQDFEEDANAVLGASDDKNCTYPQGYIKRQALYACLTCCTEAKDDPTKRAGVCLACSLTCHENHELIELYTKRNFRCDCGNPKFNSHICQFTPNKTDLNDDNIYNQNFCGLYCVCHRPYPDPEATEDDTMIQCIICEDWLHASHLEAIVPPNDQYAEMICKLCMEKNEFLHDYTSLTVNVETFDVDVITLNSNSFSFEENKTTSIQNTSDIVKDTKNTDVEMAEDNTASNSKVFDNIGMREPNEDSFFENEKIIDDTNTEITKADVKNSDENEKDSLILQSTVAGAAENSFHEKENLMKYADTEMTEGYIENIDEKQKDFTVTLETNSEDNKNIDTTTTQSDENTKIEEQTVQKATTDVEDCVEHVMEDALNNTAAQEPNDYNCENINSNDAQPNEAETNFRDIVDSTELETNMNKKSLKNNLDVVKTAENDKIYSETENHATHEDKSEQTIAEQISETDIEIRDDSNEKNKTDIPEENEKKELECIFDEHSIIHEQEDKLKLDGITNTTENMEDKQLLEDLNALTSDKSELEKPEVKDSILDNNPEISVEEKSKDDKHIDDIEKSMEFSDNVSQHTTEKMESSEIQELAGNKNIEVIDNKDITVTDKESIDKTDEVMSAIDEILKSPPDIKDNSNLTDNSNNIEINEDTASTNTEDVEMLDQKKHNNEINLYEEAAKLLSDSEVMVNNEKEIDEIEDKSEPSTNNKVANETLAIKDSHADESNVEMNVIPVDINAVTASTNTEDIEMSDQKKHNNEINLNEKAAKLLSDSEVMVNNEKEIDEIEDKSEPSTNNKVANETLDIKDSHADESNVEMNVIPVDINAVTKTDEFDKPIETNDNSEKENEIESHVLTECTNKRKLDTELDDKTSKKIKLSAVKTCIRPKGVKRVYKGATFWPANFRQKLCTCGECISMYRDLDVLFLTDIDDTVTAYERLGKENIVASQYEKGLEALSSLDRIQQINALTEYNKMRDKLLDFLKSFKDKDEIVKEEDIKAFFAGMKPRREPDGVYFCR